MRLTLSVLCVFVVFLGVPQISDAWDDNDLSLMQDYEIDPLLYNGTRSVAGEFLPMGWIGNCTGTAVGPQAIFTAAHCVRHGSTITFRPRYDGQAYSMVCSRHSRYNDRTVYNDYAICRLRSGEFPETMPLASFEFRSPAVGERLLLNGYGAPNVRVHHWGPETVTRDRGQDIIACGRVFLGGGDSGGSLLTWTDDRSGKSGFKVLGVNSRSDRRSCSYFNRVNDAGFKSWAEGYEDATGALLCGVSLDCSDQEPEPEPEPELPCFELYAGFGACIGTSGVEACILKAEQLRQCVE